MVAMKDKLLQDIQKTNNKVAKVRPLSVNTLNMNGLNSSDKCQRWLE